MIPRILIAPAIFALMLLIACGGGSKSTPTPGSPTPTPEPVACATADISAALIASDDLVGAQYLSIGITNIRSGACFLNGPPTINWYSTAGAKLDIPASTNVTCQPQAGDFTTCVFDGQVTLPAGAPTPAANVNGQAVAFIGVADIDALEQCASPSETAHSIGLAFTGVAADVEVELTDDIALQICSAQVTLQGYGPLATPQE